MEQEVKMGAEVKIPLPGIQYSNVGLWVSVGATSDKISKEKLKEMVQEVVDEVRKQLADKLQGDCKGLIDELVAKGTLDKEKELTDTLQRAREAYKELLTKYNNLLEKK